MDLDANGEGHWQEEAQDSDGSEEARMINACRPVEEGWIEWHRARSMLTKAWGDDPALIVGGACGRRCE